MLVYSFELILFFKERQAQGQVVHPVCLQLQNIKGVCTRPLIFKAFHIF